MMTCIGCGLDFDAMDEAQSIFHSSYCEEIRLEYGRDRAHEIGKRLFLSPPPQSQERDYASMAEKLYNELEALPDEQGTKGNFLPVCVVCDYVGVMRFRKALERILIAILAQPGEGE